MSQTIAPSEPRVWNVPFKRNFFFTGRKSILEEIHSALAKSHAAAISQPPAISGLGGVGKTQVAIEYAYCFEEEYQYILWSQADSLEIITASYLSIASLLNLSEQAEQDQSRVVSAVKHWLETNTNWLLILDNADDLPLLENFLPRKNTGHIVITTRASAGGNLAQCIEIEEMDLQEGTLFLLRRARLLELEISLPEGVGEDYVKAEEIVYALGGLPLAIDQAGAYLEETRCTLNEYFHLLQDKGVELLKERGEYPGSHTESVATTFSLALQKVQQYNQDAADLLMLCAFLAPDGIPEEIFSRLPSDMRTLDDKLNLNNAIRSLLKFSLIRREIKGEMPVIIIHRLVQAVICDTLKDSEKLLWINMVIEMLNKNLKSIDEDKWVKYEIWIVNVLNITSYIRKWNISSVDALELLCETGVYLRDLANYKEAESLLLLALEICKNVDDLHRTAFCKCLLATVYDESGKHKEEKKLYQEALELFEKLPESETAYILYSQAELYCSRGKYREAEPLYNKALEAHQKQFGNEHSGTVNCMNNLGMLYKFLGKYKEAQSLLEMVLNYRQKTLGVNHPYTAISISNLGDLLQALDRYDEAEVFYRRALAIRRRILGPNHPDTALSLNNLAGTCESLGRYKHDSSRISRMS